MNWQRMLWDLRREYKPLAKLAREIDVNPKTLQSIARGDVKDVYYTLGNKLVKIHDMHIKHR